MKTVRISRGASLALVTVLSSTSLAQGQTPPDVVGVWSTSMTVRQDEAWQIEDYGCFLGCPASAYEHLRSLVGDSANDARPFEELRTRSWLPLVTKLARQKDEMCEVFSQVPERKGFVQIVLMMPLSWV